MTTEVGGYLVSTVGEYFPSESTREILATSRGVVLEGRGGARDADYMKKIGFEEIGLGRKYETMVFKSGPPCSKPKCNCGLPCPEDYCELHSEGYNWPGDAREGHMKICQQVAEGAIPKKGERDL